MYNAIDIVFASTRVQYTRVRNGRVLACYTHNNTYMPIHICHTYIHCRYPYTCTGTRVPVRVLEYGHMAYLQILQYGTGTSRYSVLQ